jgi:hypothetical protein
VLEPASCSVTYERTGRRNGRAMGAWTAQLGRPLGQPGREYGDADMVSTRTPATAGPTTTLA